MCYVLTMPDWNARYENWPDWKDVGRKVEAEVKGAMVCGTLEAEEIWTGEDEVPLFTILTSDGNEVNFVDAERWRYLAEAG